MIAKANKNDHHKPSKKRKISTGRYGNKKKKNVVIDGQFTLIKDVEPPKEIKIARVLPHWLLHPRSVQTNLKDDSKSISQTCPILDQRLVNKLKVNGIQKLFPVQQSVIPQILKDTFGMENRICPQDICVATPTGSGKTLAYVLPVVQVLNGSVMPAIGALIILPVIELAKQVYKVFSTYAAVFKLKVGQVYGALSFSAEQELLVQQTYAGIQSKVHIVIATPGRLMDHITKTKGLDFSLLRFLILDEADKLMVGESGEILSRIQNYILKFKHKKINLGLPPLFPIQPDNSFQNSRSSLYNDTLSSLTKRNTLDDEKKLSSLFREPFVKEVITLDDDECDGCSKEEKFFHIPLPPLQRLLFSATLSSDPEQLQNVSLYRPILFTSERSPSAVQSTGDGDQEESNPVRPQELSEEYVKTELSKKPLILHYILKKEKKKKTDFKALVFTGSLELTSKITVLLQSLSRSKYSVLEFSSNLKKDRKLVISKFLKGDVDVLVSSDAMARGIDIPNVDCVISYDVPSAFTYVHRIGRTARAGNQGTAISIVTKLEFKHLKRILGGAFDYVKEREIPIEKLQKFETSFSSALKDLGDAMQTRTKKGKRIKKTLNRRKMTNKRNVRGMNNKKN